MKIGDLKTPCAVLDLDVLERNTARMAERVARLGARLRPHVKTHKCLEAARLQVRGHFGGITVSTLAEARFFAQGGFRDITYAFPLPLSSLDDAAELTRSLDRLSVLLDHEATLQALEAYGNAQGVRFSVFLKVDCGYHRAGVDPSRPESVELAHRLSHSPCVDFRGILTHAGHSYDCRNAEEIRVVSEQERAVMVSFAERLRRAEIPVSEVSVGSTPTMSHASSLEGVTEARPGNYVFYDAFQATVGSCRMEDAALSVLATVVGQYPDQQKLLVNVGALALSKDEGARHVEPDCGYGVVGSPNGSRYPELRLTSISQEHGQVHGRSPIDFAKYEVGSRLRVIPNHSCLTAAMYDRYFVVRGDSVVDEWKTVRGW